MFDNADGWQSPYARFMSTSSSDLDRPWTVGRRLIALLLVALLLVFLPRTPYSVCRRDRSPGRE